MQVHRFPNGGFVAHKVVLYGYKGYFSVWFNANGELVDAEKLVNGRSYAASKYARERLESLFQRVNT